MNLTILSLYHKELAEEFEKQFTCLGENTEIDITFTVSIEKEVWRIDKNGEEITKDISYRLQAQHLCQAHSQILSIIFLKEFIKLDVNTDTMIKNLKLAELNVNIATVSLNTQTLKMI